MSRRQDFLIEIGTEELPPKALRPLMEAFGANLEAAIDDARLKHGSVHAYASPRRLAVMVANLAEAQDDRAIEQKGPPTRIAFDESGQPTAAAEAFAKKCGVAIDALERVQTEKGEWLVFNTVERGRSAADLMPELVERALGSLPIPRRMRWGAGDAEFVRPVHWIVMLHGKNVVETSIMGVPSGRETRGHRYHSSGPISLAKPGDYVDALEKPGYVIADFARRREMVREGVEAAAGQVGGSVVDGESLYDEVASLVEWPVPIVGAFDEIYLELPREVVVSTLTGHQRYFPVADDRGTLLPHFVTVANLESKDPEQVIEGNRITETRGPRFVSPFAIPALSGSMAACLLSMEWGLTGPVQTQVAAAVHAAARRVSPRGRSARRWVSQADSDRVASPLPSTHSHRPLDNSSS